MDIGIHVSLWTPEWTAPFLAYMRKASALGFDLVEIPIMNPAGFPLDEVKQVLKETGLKVSCGTGLGVKTDISSTDSAISEAGVDHLFRCIDIAAELGSPTLQGVIHSAWGARTPVDEANRKACAAGLKAVARKAADLHMSIALECINRYESSFLNTVKQGIYILNMIGENNAGLHLDTYHMNIEENSFQEAFSTAGNRMFHLHLSENQRGFPGGGLLDWKMIVQSAKSAGYRGPWVIESYVYPEFPTGNDVCIWRPIENDPENDLKKSLAMVRELLV
ncbi:MAG: sugar phosphate isomerase/epimerase [Spirochaetia bacterium]|nr:sugar phosphate isomerase/epimerase [Spirochaetia bacterium]